MAVAQYGDGVMTSQFGSLLKEWRGRRRVSQLDLALAADVSARHVAFLETGRSRPTRAMVIRLSEALDVPRPERNALLGAAGLAPAYRRRPLDDAEMAPFRAAIAWTLERHAPYPAMAIDRRWNIEDLNPTAAAMLTPLGLGRGASMLEAFAGSDALRGAIVNWDETARHILARLRSESAALGGDAVLDDGARRIERSLGAEAASRDDPLPPAVPTQFRVGETTLSFFSTIAQFGSAEDIALSDLRIELMFPADTPTRAFLEAFAGAASAG